MNLVLNTLGWLEWLAKYGFIEIFFGIGIIGFVARLMKKAVPSNYDHLHITVLPGGAVQIPGDPHVPNSVRFVLNNAGQTNLFVARAYFRPKFRRWWSLWLWRKSTAIRIHPLSYRIPQKDAYELKFTGNNSGFTNYETLVPPAHSTGQVTWLPLQEPLQQSEVDKRHSGVIYVEYATSGKQGVHVVRV